MTTSRTEMFSDGVFAISITLLVLEIRVPPDTALGPALLSLWPSYVAYVTSFLLIGAIWLNHHTMFEQIVFVNSTLMLFNLLALMTIAFMPFPTAVLAHALHKGSGENIAAAFYGGTLTLAGIFINLIWRYAARRPELLDPTLSTAQVSKMSRRYLLAPVAYLLAAVIALVLPYLALLLYGLLIAFYLWPRPVHEPAQSAFD